MKNSLRQFDRRPTGASSPTVYARTGFTMIELLVAVSILVILTTLTVSAFNVNDADRVSNSISTFKNALEGARSRAINSSEVRGLRLITDPTDGRIVKSVVYIGSAGTVEPDGVLLYEPSNKRWVFGNDNTTEWEALIDKKLIIAGLRIEIPSDSGRWYTVSGGQKNYSNTTDSIFTAGTREVLFLAEQYYPNLPTGTTTPSFAAMPTSNLTARLELAPTILEGADPILLDPQTCIDMDGSIVPNNWRPGAVADAYGVDTTPVSPAPDIFTNMDILFAPDGTITGDARTFGVFCFRFAYVSDVFLAENMSGRLQVKATPPASPPAAVVPADPEKTHKALSIFSQTGGVSVAEIDPTTSGALNSGFNNDVASQPFSFALLGKESN